MLPKNVGGGWGWDILAFKPSILMENLIFKIMHEQLLFLNSS